MQYYSDFMSRNPLCIEADAVVMDAIDQMKTTGISSILVTHSSKPIGIFSERDLLLKLDLRDPQLPLRTIALAKAIGEKDPYTAGHQHRVAKIACLIALGEGTHLDPAAVQACLAVVARDPAGVSGIRYEIGAMGTLVEGEVDRSLQVARELHELPFGRGAIRIYTVIKLDDRRDKPSTIESKLDSVREKIV
jgi:uncharacterized protein (TIGR00106 family)